MAVKGESCFYYPDNTKTIFSLRQFLLEKKKKLQTDIDKRMISDEKADIARKYIKRIDEILRTDYFKSSEFEIRVTELMIRLKKDDTWLKAEIDKMRKKLPSMEQYLRDMRAANHAGYTIPDESDLLEKSIMEYKSEVEAVREELKAYEYMLVLCRDLKGIICRPNGFFDAVYKLKA